MLLELVVVFLVYFFYQSKICSFHIRISMGTFCKSCVFLFHTDFRTDSDHNTTVDGIRHDVAVFSMGMDA